jgi:hypothetical protein
MKQQNRLKSPIFWIGVLTSLIPTIAIIFALNQEQVTAISVLLTTIVTVIEAFNVYAIGNNPTNPNGY